MSRLRSLRRVGYLATTAVVTLAVAVPPATARQNPTRLAERLVRQVSGAGANRHLIAFQRIAEQNNLNRAAGTSGYDASADYVEGKLEAAGFIVDRQEFEFEFVEIANAEFEQVSPTPTVYEYTGDTSGQFLVADTSGSGDAEASLVGVDLVLPPTPEPNGSTSGCETADFADFPAGAIALIQRGTCFFVDKALNAQAAGASAVVLFNEGQPGRQDVFGAGGFDPAVTIPVVTTSFALGEELANTPDVVVRVATEVVRETRPTTNVIAQTRTGRTDNVVMAGAHLDSVLEGPGINDNGSGSASLIELALKLGGSPRVNNAVRFAWWGAEESGLLGSTYYVDQLSFEEQLDIALYLNFDMVASPNAAYFVYDGDDSDGEGAGPGPFGSAQIEQTFTDFFADTLAVPTEGTDFSGRSDYGPFIAVGIPSGGLFTGAEGIKTADQAAKWGGTAGIAYDPCYHQFCDNLGNLDRVALDRNVDATAWAVGIYAISTEDVNGVPSRTERAAARAASRTAAVDSADVLKDAA